MNHVFTHPGQPQMQAEVILASSAPDSPTLYTIRLRYPRIIHSEIMTHRVFSRNARSSRAVPVARMIQEVRDTPFVPWHWGKNQRGMQASEECDELLNPMPFITNAAFDQFALPYDMSREEAWLHARDAAANVAEAFMNAGYHKQIVNRLLEPFMWIDTLISSTEWENFLRLRDHGDAEDHLQDLARLMKRAIQEAEVQTVPTGEWHLPYITARDVTQANMSFGGTLLGTNSTALTEFLCKISAARCARISYAPFDGDASHERELQRYDSLVSSDRVHASPLEHQATPDTMSERYSAEGEPVGEDWDTPYHHGNFRGWIQYRKTVPGEAVW